mmetsp:Transcript_62041/g.145562  ORF Transcript_62041/g.145562 Transcript_62041/m.145562 type:complete len:205 (+) Transcript_62041:295-909(+)
MARKALQVLENVVDHRVLRLGVTSGVLLRGRDPNFLHLHVVHNHGMPLTPGVAQSSHDPSMGQLKANLFGEQRAAVTVERHDGAIDLLILRPSIHHSGVVHAVDNDIRDALGLQISLFCQVARDLLGRSGGGEGTRQAHHHHLLATDDLLKRDLLRREALIQGYVRELHALGNSLPSIARSTVPHAGSALGGNLTRKRSRIAPA